MTPDPPRPSEWLRERPPERWLHVTLPKKFFSRFSEHGRLRGCVEARGTQESCPHQNRYSADVSLACSAAIVAKPIFNDVDCVCLRSSSNKSPSQAFALATERICASLGQLSMPIGAPLERNVLPERAPRRH